MSAERRRRYLSGRLEWSLCGPLPSRSVDGRVGTGVGRERRRYGKVIRAGAVETTKFASIANNYNHQIVSGIRKGKYWGVTPRNQRRPVVL